MAARIEEIKRSLVQQILVGQYPLGSRLPSCRDLAGELGINRNTANRVYRELAQQGLVRAVRGQGFIVINQRGAGLALAPSLRDRILSAGREAKLLGIERVAFLQMAVEVANSIYKRQRPTIAFVECNEEDLARLTSEIEGELSYPVDPVLVSVLEQSPEGIAQAYDIVCTTLYHLTGVMKAMSMAEEKVIAVHAVPDTDVLLEIARLDSQPRLGIICETATTQQYLASAVALIHHGHLRSCLLSDAESVRKLQHTVDLVIDVPSCHREVACLLPNKRTLTIPFHIDRESLAPLRGRLASLINQEMDSILSLRPSLDHNATPQ